jgi:hypothetical protein
VSFSDDPHAFVQLIEAVNGNTYYIRFPKEYFNYRTDRFEIFIDGNYFSENRIILDLKDQGIRMTGKIELIDPVPFPQKLTAPGIMGWYSFVPRMECYHGVVSLGHHLEGEMEINRSRVDFSGGKGYIEKDWGTSMPSDWIWMQSNHFRDHVNASFMLSVARIPWRNGFFPGFLSFLYFDGHVYRFATYNGSRITEISVSKEIVRMTIQNNRYQLKLEAIPNKSGRLKAPRHGSMDRDIFESLNSSLNVTLSRTDGDVLFSSSGEHAGLEIVGNVERYFK